MTRTITIRTTFACRRWWRVVVHDTVAELQDAAHRYRPFLGREHWDGTEGCCHPAGRIDWTRDGPCFPRNGFCGVIRYAEPSLTAEIVTHELVHAAAATLRSHLDGRDIRLGNGYAGSNLREEQLAYIYGELFADLHEQL